jgi:hypothetical protein
MQETFAPRASQQRQLAARTRDKQRFQDDGFYNAVASKSRNWNGTSLRRWFYQVREQEGIFANNEFEVFGMFVRRLPEFEHYGTQLLRVFRYYSLSAQFADSGI